MTKSFKVVDGWPSPATIEEAETALAARRLYVRVLFVSPRAPKSKPVPAYRIANGLDAYGNGLDAFRVAPEAGE